MFYVSLTLLNLTLCRCFFHRLFLCFWFGQFLTICSLVSGSMFFVLCFCLVNRKKKIVAKQRHITNDKWFWALLLREPPIKILFAVNKLCSHHDTYLFLIKQMCTQSKNSLSVLCFFSVWCFFFVALHIVLWCSLAFAEFLHTQFFLRWIYILDIHAGGFQINEGLNKQDKFYVHLLLADTQDFQVRAIEWYTMTTTTTTITTLTLIIINKKNEREMYNKQNTERIISQKSVAAKLNDLFIGRFAVHIAIHRWSRWCQDAMVRTYGIEKWASPCTRKLSSHLTCCLYASSGKKNKQ